MCCCSYIVGRYHSLGVDGGRGSIVRVGRTISVAGQSKGYAKSTAVKAGKTSGPTAGQSVENRRVGQQGKRSSRRDDILVPCDEDTFGSIDETPYRQGKSQTGP